MFTPTTQNASILERKSIVLFVFVLANLIIATPADSLWPLFKQSALSVSLAWTVMICLSYIIKRPRPFKVRGEKALVKMWLETPSFPSGHTTLAFALASASCFSSLQPGIVVLAAFIMAAMVAFSRLYVGVHYLSDIFGGIAVGVGVVWLVFG